MRFGAKNFLVNPKDCISTRNCLDDITVTDNLRVDPLESLSLSYRYHEIAICSGSREIVWGIVRGNAEVEGRR